jgi:hypothetical protein
LGISLTKNESTVVHERYTMSELKFTVTVIPENNRKEKAAAYRAGYCVCLAYTELSYEMQKYFQRFGVRVWPHKSGFVTVDVKLKAWFPHGRVPHQKYRRNFSIESPMDMFRNDTQVPHSAACLKQEFMNILEEHLQELRSNLVRGTKLVNEQLRHAIGKKTSL